MYHPVYVYVALVDHPSAPPRLRHAPVRPSDCSRRAEYYSPEGLKKTRRGDCGQSQGVIPPVSSWESVGDAHHPAYRARVRAASSRSSTRLSKQDKRLKDTPAHACTQADTHSPRHIVAVRSPCCSRAWAAGPHPPASIDISASASLCPVVRLPSLRPTRQF